MKKLILHRAKPDGTALPDWEFKYAGTYFERLRIVIDRAHWVWNIYISDTGNISLFSSFRYRETPRRWSYVHATGITLPGGTEIKLPRGKA